MEADMAAIVAARLRCCVCVSEAFSSRSAAVQQARLVTVETVRCIEMSSFSESCHRRHESSQLCLQHANVSPREREREGWGAVGWWGGTMGSLKVPM